MKSLKSFVTGIPNFLANITPGAVSLISHIANIWMFFSFESIGRMAKHPRPPPTIRVFRIFESVLKIRDDLKSFRGSLTAFLNSETTDSA